jgi:site-specific DNA-cytosine methylase
VKVAQLKSSCVQNESKIILDLCGGTGSWSNPYREARYDVRLVTLPEYDVRLFVPPDGVWGILAAPPCTEFSFAKHFHGKGKYKHDFKSGLAIVDACVRIVWVCRDTLQWWVLENPKGYLERWMGKPTMTFDPYEYGDNYQKKTCLWGEFTEPKKCKEKKPEMKFSMLKSKDIHPEYYPKLSRQVRRAITPAGFAKAFFEANP